MRYSTSKRFDIAEISGKRKGDQGNSLFFNRVARESSPQDRAAGILLLGGTSHADLAIRRAQSDLRFDRLPSRWSHAVLILDWPERAAPGEILCAEVALHPRDPAGQVPERNGVTLGSLEPYADPDLFPNLAFGTICGDLGPRAASDLKEKIIAAALHPSRDRTRFPLWEWLGDWHHFVHRGDQNPLLDHRSHPGAAFCEYAYGAAGIDLTPGALEPNACPEMLWSTLLYWYAAVDGGTGAVRAWRFVDPDDDGRAVHREGSDLELKGDLAKLRRNRDKAAKPARRKASRKKSRKRAR